METRDRESENESEPGEAKEEQYSTDADHDVQDGFTTHCFFFLSSNSPYMPNQHNTDSGEDNSIEQYYHKYGSTHQCFDV